MLQVRRRGVDGFPLAADFRFKARKFNTLGVDEESDVPVADMRVLVLANQKGGVGKTTTAINLGTALAAMGERVLIIDLDPQGNASTGLGIDRAGRKISTYDVLNGQQSLRAVLRETGVPRLSIAPRRSISSVSNLKSRRARTAPFVLRKRSRPSPKSRAADLAEERFTYVLVDCPPSLNLLTMNAMAAADSVVVPLQCEFFALEGLSQLLTTVEQVRNTLNPKLTIHGIVLTMFDSAQLRSPRKSWPMCGDSWATRSMKRSSRATSGCPKRHRMASRCFSTILNAAAAKPISNWRRR